MPGVVEHDRVGRVGKEALATMRGSGSALSGLIAAGSCILGTACVDVPTPPESELPFEARIDGQPFVPAGTDFATHGGGTSLIITGVRETGPGTYRQVSVQVLGSWDGPGTYTLTALPDSGEVGAIGFVVDQTEDFGTLGRWITTADAPGQMVVTAFDAANRTIKGTFSFVARSDSGQPASSLSVTAGRFMGSFYVDP